MTDRDRSRWCWDRVWIGCGKSKAPTRSTAGDMEVALEDLPSGEPDPQLTLGLESASYV